MCHFLPRHRLFLLFYVWGVLPALLLAATGNEARAQLISPTPTPRATPSAPTPTISAEAYEDQLDKTVAQLKAMENRSRRPLKPLLEGLAQPLKVRRGDGAVQEVGGGEWQRRADALTTPQGSASRQQVRNARKAVETRRAELRLWMRANYTPASAQEMVNQLEKTGQIRTGPTWWQQFRADFLRSLSQAFLRFMQWLSGLLPAISPGNAPSIDPRIFTTIFYLTVGALVVLFLWLLWRVLGGRLGRRGAKREVRFLEGEDAELLQLPPDELRDRAGRFAADGNFREALRHRFISLLLTLDTHGLWHYDTRRTNWEHIAALRRRFSSAAVQASVIEPLSDLTRRFDRVRYGNAPCDRDDWSHFEQNAAAVEAAASSVNVATGSTPSGSTPATRGTARATA